MLRRRIVLLLLVATASFGLTSLGRMGPAAAIPLDEVRCKTLAGEMKALEDQGAVSDLLTGPAWAEANLPADRVATLKHYISLKEEVLFRCPSLHAGVPPDPAAGDVIYGPPLPPEMIAKIKAREDARKKKAAAKATKAAALRKTKAEKAKKKKDAAAAAATAAGQTVPATPSPPIPDPATTAPDATLSPPADTGSSSN